MKIYMLKNVFVDFEYRGLEQVETYLFKDFESAKKELEKHIEYLKEDYVVDTETPIKNIEIGNTYRFFFKNQENWDCYYEYTIESYEV